MLVFIITDSMHFTRHWVQYCHPTLVCKRKSHSYAFFKITSIAKKVLRKLESLELFVLLFLEERTRFTAQPTADLETWIDKFTVELPPLTNFIIPVSY